MTAKQLFGTDGIRGPVGGNAVNPEFMLKLGWAVGKVLCHQPGDKVLIGKDTRISGYMIESALEAGLSAAGMHVRLLGPLPTPGIAYLTKTLRAAAGIVISASHNPYFDNGIKFFSSEGQKLTEEVEQAIAKTMGEPMQMVASAYLGKAGRIDDAVGRYAEFCKQSFAPSLTCSGLKVVLDCAHGATYQVAPIVFTELGAEVITIGNTPDGLNINLDCGSTHPAQLQQAVLAHQADVGIAFDGDGDRLIMVDHQGRLVDGDQCLYVMVAHALHKQEKVSGVVGTLMSNQGLVKSLQDLGVELVRANVGDKYVLAALHERGWLMGGEPSGHLLHLGKSSAGDGIIAALQILLAMVEQKKSLAELCAGMAKFPQLLINVAVTHSATEVVRSEVVQAAVTNAQAKLGDRGRVLIRPSGTEPLVRIMVEAEEAAQAKSIADRLHEVVEHEASLYQCASK